MPSALLRNCSVKTLNRTLCVVYYLLIVLNSKIHATRILSTRRIPEEIPPILIDQKLSSSSTVRPPLLPALLFCSTKEVHMRSACQHVSVVLGFPSASASRILPKATALARASSVPHDVHHAGLYRECRGCWLLIIPTALFILYRQQNMVMSSMTSFSTKLMLTLQADTFYVCLRSFFVGVFRLCRRVDVIHR